MELSSTALADALSAGKAVIIQSRLLLQRCEVTGTKSRRLAQDFVLARPHRARGLIRGASDRVDTRGQGPREVWRHRPTGHHWVVVTDATGAAASAAGPFTAKEWDPLLREYVILDVNHSLEWLREHIDEFVRDDVLLPNQPKRERDKLAMTAQGLPPSPEEPVI